ncbi:MAG: hypothetical protein HY077_10295 [Elusimicrobia bacterium]|nr:hypothetical protein [Elusimicrobiota bacterium]
MRPLLPLCLLLLGTGAWAQEDYGQKGIYPIYEVSGQWVVFDKRPVKGATALAAGSRFLVIGSEGSSVFDVARTSGTYGGACRGHKPLRLRAALLKGPRSAVGRPIIGIRVAERFTLKGSRAVYRRLPSKVGEATYTALDGALRKAAAADLEAGRFPLKSDDEAAHSAQQNPKPDKFQIKIDFGSDLPLKGLPNAFVLVEESEVSASSRRCLRLADGGALVGECAEMPRALMAETALLDFVAYDPSGAGSPFLLAYTKSTPLWGDERWGFVLKPSGPRLFLKDAMDIRCREGF